jgi:phosphotransferase system enzyme I (PtsI)
VLIECNIGKPADLELGIKNGCEGVGLYRSEFLYMDNDH